MFFSEGYNEMQRMLERVGRASYFNHLWPPFAQRMQARYLIVMEHVPFVIRSYRRDGDGRGLASDFAVMKSAYRSVMFYIGQKELEMQCKMNKLVGQCRQKCEALQEKFSEKLEQMHTAYQKMAKRCHVMEQEIESLSKDKQELQEKFAEKSRQKRKLDEMYDQLRSEFESAKRSAIQPAQNFYSRPEPDLFSNPNNMMDNQDTLRKDRLVFTPETPGPREEIWPARQNSSNSGGAFDVSACSPSRRGPAQMDGANRRSNAQPPFGSGNSNPSMTLRNLVLSPIKRPQLSRNRPQLFTM
ncbi:E3 ubiquitin-protein ligase CCNB1IP1-like protein [Bienertia sinuspersici]